MFLRFSCILLPVYGQRLVLDMKAPRLDILTPVTIVGSAEREFMNSKGEIATYEVALCVQGETEFEVTWRKIGFRPPVGNQKVKLRIDAQMGVKTAVKMMTWIGAKNDLGYLCEIQPVATPDEAASAASAHAVH